MAEDRQVAFGSFRFAPRTGQLWCDASEVRLTPRAAAVLQRLIECAQEIVTKQDLFDRVWGGLAVTDDALTSCIGELRAALGDDARRPRYIETRHRRGFRLMMPVAEVADEPGTTPKSSVTASPSTRLVGRDAELEELMRRFEAAAIGRREIVFVTGEPGIGKSALVDTFLERMQAGHAVRIAHGQCLDHHGVGEPYLPLIEAFTRLALGRDGAPIKDVLSAQAPSWFALMPSLWTQSDRDRLGARGRATRERMIRELTLAVEALASDAPLLIKLEDVHWSDASTLDWLAHVARRREPASVMVLATARPAEAAGAKVGLYALMNELAVHGLCSEIELYPLELPAVEKYLALRLGERSGKLEPKKIAQPLFDRTGGNPLFMVSLVNQLTRREAAGRSFDPILSIPRDIRRFIDRQIDELSETDRYLLMAASVIAREFAAAAVAAALNGNVQTIEADCARLARQGVFIGKPGSTVWPDGTRTETYSFRHDLYRELLYDRLAATSRATSHDRVGRRIEEAWAGKLDEVASELAEHFERANESARAIPHHQRAAAKALRRSANAEAIGYLRRALAGIGAITDEGERTKREVELQVALGAAFIANRGFSAPEVLEAYSKAEALCERLGERADLFPAIWGQWMFRTGRSEMDAARRLCQRLLDLAEKFGDSGLKIEAHHAMWSTSFVCGAFDQTRAHAQAGLKLFDAKLHRALASSYGNHDVACCARNFSAMALALVGDRDGAHAMIEQVVVAAKALDDPFTLALALFFTATAAQILGDVSLAGTNSALSMEMATEHDLAQPRAWSMGVAGWCASESGQAERGLMLVTDAIAAMNAIHSRHFLAYLLGLLADVHLKAGRLSKALTAADHGLAVAEATGERFYSAELHRLRGECFARQPQRKQEAEVAFRAAMRLAGQQGAATLEQKAHESLLSWSR
jgi:predicted ATPase